MDLVQLMESHGFGASSSGGGCEWYTKEVQFGERMAFVAVTCEDGCGLPESIEDPVLVGVYDMDSGELLEEVKRIDSLKSFLASL